MRQTLFLYLLLGFLLTPAFSASPEMLAPTPVQPWERTDGLPASKQGRFPVMMPKYEGVDQLLVLSNRWVVVVTNNIDAVYDAIDRLSHGVFSKRMATWENSLQRDIPNWVAHHDMADIHDDYVAEARQQAGERRLEQPDYFAITGSDPAYAAPRTPARVTRLIVGHGKNLGPAQGKLHDASVVYYTHYSYLELPAPMQQGGQYVITLKDGRKVTFIYDETRTIARTIKVNQVGYLPDAGKKYAYLGGYLGALGPQDFSAVKEFKVVDVQTGAVVLRGPVTLREKNPRMAVVPGKEAEQTPETRPLLAGEDVYQLDLSGLQAQGEFFITIAGVGRSWTFRHAPDIYGQVFYTLCRGLYHQRCGIALGPPYTNWPRKACHTDSIYESENIAWGTGARFDVPPDYEAFDVVGGTIDVTQETTEHARGGWHDAADWDRNLFHYNDVFALLTAYELAPGKFTDGQLHLPESGNGIPDILDEAEFGLQCWRQSMTADGGVAGSIETKTHPAMDDNRNPYAYSQRTRWSSLLFAAAAAQYAQLVRPFKPEQSATYAALAKKAYTYGMDPEHSLGETEIHAKKNRGAGRSYTIPWTETDDMVKPFQLFAKCRLYLLTGEAAYLDGVPELSKAVENPVPPAAAYHGYPYWMYYAIPRLLEKQLPAETVQRWRAFYLREGANQAALLEGMPYRCTYQRHMDFWMAWGNTVMTNFSRPLLGAWVMTKEPKLRDAAICNFDHQLGANPMGMSWITGLGYTYPIDIQHGVSQTDGILDPVPGIAIYGINGGMYYELTHDAWSAPKDRERKEFVDFMPRVAQTVPIFRCYSTHPGHATEQNEFTIWETMANAIFASALLMPDGWTPAPEQTDRTPRPDPFLFGYYYLP